MGFAPAIGAVGVVAGESRGAAGHPAFEVDHVGVFGAQVAGATLQEPVGQAEVL